MQENFSDKLANAATRQEREALEAQAEVVQTKIQRVKDCSKLLVNFDEFITEESWNARFELPLDLYLE